jgi:hypothetical protein
MNKYIVSAVFTLMISQISQPITAIAQTYPDSSSILRQSDNFFKLSVTKPDCIEIIPDINFPDFFKPSAKPTPEQLKKLDALQKDIPNIKGLPYKIPGGIAPKAL